MGQFDLFSVLCSTFFIQLHILKYVVFKVFSERYFDWGQRFVGNHVPILIPPWCVPPDPTLGGFQPASPCRYNRASTNINENVKWMTSKRKKS